jgi:hypothetical protein
MMRQKKAIMQRDEKVEKMDEEIQRLRTATRLLKPSQRSQASGRRRPRAEAKRRFPG